MIPEWSSRCRDLFFHDGGGPGVALTGCLGVIVLASLAALARLIRGRAELRALARRSSDPMRFAQAAAVLLRRPHELAVLAALSVTMALVADYAFKNALVAWPPIVGDASCICLWLGFLDAAFALGAYGVALAAFGAVEARATMELLSRKDDEESYALPASAHARR